MDPDDVGGSGLGAGAEIAGLDGVQRQIVVFCLGAGDDVVVGVA